MFSPGRCCDSYLQNIHLIRYPFTSLPKDLEDLFRLFPVKEDYDTSSSLVADALVSVSPSLIEAESQESAWGIFINNERKCDVSKFIGSIFESEKVSSPLFRKKIKTLVKDAPKSRHGLIYSFLIPKDAPVYKAVYLSQPYGIPEGNPLAAETLKEFYECYERGSLNEDNPQLRFLPSALSHENGFDLNQIKSYRFTTMPENDLTDYAQKVQTVVRRIYKDHLEEMLDLAAQGADAEKLSTHNEKQTAYQKLCCKHLCRNDHHQALYYWQKLDDQNPQKGPCLTGVIACLLKNTLTEKALQLFEKYEDLLVYKDQLTARFALIYIEQDNRSLFESMLSKLSDPDIRTFILLMAGSRYPEYLPDNYPEDFSGLMSDEELFNLADVSA